MKTPALLAIAVLLSFGLSGKAQQDTAKAKSDTSDFKASTKDTLALEPKPEPRQVAAYKIDTTFEAVNLERYYYGMDGIDGAYEYNPWEEVLFQDADALREDERDQRDQERDTRE
jgi:hypothetical protein